MRKAEAAQEALLQPGLVHGRPLQLGPRRLAWGGVLPLDPGRARLQEVHLLKGAQAQRAEALQLLDARAEPALGQHALRQRLKLRLGQVARKHAQRARHAALLGRAAAVHGRLLPHVEQAALQDEGLAPVPLVQPLVVDGDQLQLLLDLLGRVRLPAFGTM